MANAITNQLVQLQNATANESSKKERSQDLDQDAFLQLMMVQLKNQDPTNPMDSSEFLAQQAQFTQISELQKLNNNLTTSTVFSQASSVIGREVIAADPNTEEGYVQGVVDCASIDSKGNVMYLINGKEYPMSAISIIGGVAQADASGSQEATKTEAEPQAQETKSEG